MNNKQSYNRKIALSALLLLALNTPGTEEPTVTIRALNASCFVYEPFQLQVDVRSAEMVEEEIMEEVQRPVMLDGSGYTITSISQGAHPAGSAQNITSFRIEVVATGRGLLTIAPAVVQIGERSFQTEPLRVAVDEPRRAAECSMEVRFGTTNLYVDQAVEITVAWQSSTPFVQFQEVVIDLPVLRDEGFDVYPLDPAVAEKERIGLPVNAQRVIAHKTSDDQGESLSFKYMLVPRRAGQYDFGELRFSCAVMHSKQSSNQYPSYFNNSFFVRPEKESRFERVFQTARIPALTVAPLPDEGRSALYCGVAGGLEAEALIHPAEVVVGQPMRLEVALTNMAFGRQIAALPDAVLENIGPAFKLTREPIGASATLGSRRFVYALRPLLCATDWVPGLAMQVFDVERGEYRMVRTAPLKVLVLPDGSQRVYTPEPDEAERVRVRLTGIRGNNQQSTILMNGYDIVTFIGKHAWFFWLLPVAGWLLLRGRIRHIERCRVDTDYARASQARCRFKRMVRSDEELAFRTYIADRFGLCAEALTLESSVNALTTHGLPDEVVQMVRDYMQACDTKKYSPSRERKASRMAVRKIVWVIESTAKTLLLALLVAPLLLFAGSPEERFSTAMALQMERADEARPIFVEAALGYEEKGSFFNAGNSWFFAGESGRALAAYLAAESRAPFNREVHEGLAFIRGQRRGDFPVSSGGMSALASGWQRICCWDIHLRMGFLTLLLMAAWVAYTLARLYGFKIDRRFWLVYGITVGLILITLLYSLFQPARGVVIQSAEARLGAGYAYALAYENALCPALEFQWLTSENGWVQARLPDNNLVWLHESTCVKVK